MANPNTNKILYSYIHPSNANNGVINPDWLSAYSDAVIFDLNKRIIWHDGCQFGNGYWGSSYSETFNDFEHNTALGKYNTASGTFTYAYGTASSARGYHTLSSGVASEANGFYTAATGNYSNASGMNSYARAEASSASGYKTETFGKYSSTSGSSTVTYGVGSNAMGLSSKASGNYSNAEGSNTSTIGDYSHAEGSGSKTSGNSSHAEGFNTNSNGNYSHTEGIGTTATMSGGHAEGMNTKSTADAAHSEGKDTIVSGMFAHAEGVGTHATGEGSHSEGFNTSASADYAKTTGVNTVAFGVGSQANGIGTTTRNSYEVSFGEYNNSILAEQDNAYGGTTFTIGDGTPGHYHNIIDIRKNGAMFKNGSSYFADNIYGPVSFTYVQSLGPSANLDIILSSLLTQPEYTKPNLSFSLKQASNNAFSSFRTSALTENVEVGTIFNPAIKFRWQERTPTVSGTRMKATYINADPSTLPGNYVLGYSKGIDTTSASIYLDKSNGKKSSQVSWERVNDIRNLETEIALAASITIAEPNSYPVVKGISMAYLEAEPMYFQQLYDKGVYVKAYGVGNKAWFDKGICGVGGAVANINTVFHTVNGKYYLYYGFIGDNQASAIAPTTKSGLGSSKILISNVPGGAATPFEIQLNTTTAAKYSFFIAVPSLYTLGTYDRMKIKVLQPDGVAFDMVTADQKLVESTISNMQLGSAAYKQDYTVMFVKFQNPIGNANNKIQFNIISK